VLIGLEEYEDLVEEAALSTNPEHIAMIAEARAAYQAGEGGDYEALRIESK
jgi:PHD/YefM family antitoxin component YafN of YafNO toxin-antitoxin module